MSTLQKYYLLSPAINTKETGNAYPAVVSYDDYDFNAPNSVHKLRNQEFPNFIPDIRFKLAKGAKLCDMMGQATINAHGFLISEKLKSIFEKANLIPHKFYPATIESKSVYYQYYWIHFVWDEAIEYIDFNKSKFRIKKISEDLGEIEISNYIDLKQKQGELGFIKMIYNYETTLKNPSKDLFIHGLNMAIFISEPLLRILENSFSTGFKAEIAYNLHIVD
jgi:hypothetical protein